MKHIAADIVDNILIVYSQLARWLGIQPLHDVNLAYSKFLNDFIDAINFYCASNHINRSAKKENKEVKH